MAQPLLPHGHEHEHEHESVVNEMIDDLIYEHNLTFYTVFAPTNLAFAKLGFKNVALLHSPFPIAVKSLKYILAYHIVPDVTFFSDFVVGAEPVKDHSSSQYVIKREIDVKLPAAWLASEIERTPFEMTENFAAVNDELEGKSGNVTHYELPTLLSDSGVNKNATLKVAVVEYRFLGKGPLRRSIVVLPHHDHHQDDEDHHGPPPAKPVTVFKSDNPARKGAIQVVTSVLQPPFPHCDKHENHSGVNRHAHKFSRIAAKVFAQ